MPIHVQIWSQAKNARVTDMTNAGKRGKTCRQLRLSGTRCDRPRRCTKRPTCCGRPAPSCTTGVRWIEIFLESLPI